MGHKAIDWGLYIRRHSASDSDDVIRMRVAYVHHLFATNDVTHARIERNELLFLVVLLASTGDERAPALARHVVDCLYHGEQVSYDGLLPFPDPDFRTKKPLDAFDVPEPPIQHDGSPRCVEP